MVEPKILKHTTPTFSHGNLLYLILTEVTRSTITKILYIALPTSKQELAKGKVEKLSCDFSNITNLLLSLLKKNIQNYTLTSEEGRIVLQENVTKNFEGMINVEQLEAGIYFIKFSFTDESTYTQKIIVK